MNRSSDITMENTKKTFCCERIEQAILSEDSPIEYVPVFREHKIRCVFNVIVCERIDFCPWCSYVFPKGLRNEFMRIVKRDYYITDGILDIFENKDLPEEFKSDEWWKNRGL